MTREQANRLHELALKEGLPEIRLNALPVGGFVYRGKHKGEPRTSNWYFSATVENGEEKGKLVCALARAGANRTNTDMIRDRNTYRITRLDREALS